MQVRRHPPAADTVARAFGWFGIALGAAELLAPGPVARSSGLAGRHALVRACGVREILTGIGLLTSRRPGWWMWARVAGDALDAGTLARGRGTPARVALAIVAAVAAADVACAAALARPRRRAGAAHGDPSGLPPPAPMRAEAPTADEEPADAQPRPRVRPYTPDAASNEPPSQHGAPGPRWTRE